MKLLTKDLVNICNNIALDVEVFEFNDGSVQVTLPGVFILGCYQMVTVLMEGTTPRDQMALVMVVHALREVNPDVEIFLSMSFTPYGRQDAVMVPGQANAMKAWAGVINYLNFAQVSVVDPHSIAVSHIDRLKVIEITDVLSLLPLKLDYYTLISPDAGANKKAHKICKEFGITDMVRADKARDLRTGKILETVVYGDVTDKDCLIVDDICDGGMTFIKLAEKLREGGARSIVLFVTHGIFSKGLSVFEGLIDEIYTTNSYYTVVDIEGFSGKFSIKEL